ncbi:LacI family DNA-binding transcriptional regulator [Ruegeria sp. TM1040]|jgi:DNA-binding LacI/PurR family transcriptional regulator|uniref:LacI family DNA-binding transcriptional regulator n=1 Tax=Rhodobacterales TaxID=204455 RepID=UPI0000557AEA|nr:LacI family DNA-binding transcriptional regulator [Ruegeria sp. TM1040]ABF63165.1 transcriptional regulator, LacI family [Ruegeria sp. TM1040]MDF9304674.1 LacI family DNA-binding transcriptional regulator [Tritonibacter mobilis]
MSESKIRNMEELASVSGISRPTLSKYFNNPDSVRASTRKKVEAALQEHHYQPNIYAMNQNRRLTKNIGIVVPYLADPFFAEIARVIENLVIQGGFRPILLSSHGETRQEVENLDSLRSIRPAGVLLAPLGRRSDTAAVDRFCTDVPTVLFDNNLDDLGQAFFGLDNPQSVGLMVKHLCKTGEPPVFFEMKTPTNPNAYKRRRAYIDTMEALGLDPKLVQVEGETWDFEEIGYKGGLAAIRNRELCTNTVLCSNDRLAIGFLAAAYECGLRVGCGTGCALRVAGHDDHPYARFTCPPLTTIAQDYSAIATRSVEAILNLIESGEHPDLRNSTLFEGTLIKRASA